MIIQSQATARPKRKPEKIYFRVISGGLVPADACAERRLREKKYKVGDILGANLSKLRTPGLNKHAHKIAILCKNNIDDFSAYTDAHDILKRLQIESGAACDEIGVKLHGMWCKVRLPRSFSFESMEEGEFYEAVKVICRHISSEYWPDLDAEQIESMAESFIDE